jgi:ABC-type bacteriocin/lantibiotic exporter with double-glycine peptidase domain
MMSGFKLIQAMVLPRVMLLGVLTLLSALSLLATQPFFQLAAPVLLLVFGISLVISVPNYLWKRLTVRELLLLPMLMLRFARAALNMRKAFRRFMHTPHTGTPDVQLQPNKSV